MVHKSIAETPIAINLFSHTVIDIFTTRYVTIAEIIHNICFCDVITLHVDEGQGAEQGFRIFSNVNTQPESLYIFYFIKQNFKVAIIQKKINSPLN